MQDAWRAYLELALGLTEASRKKAAQVIRNLAEQSGEKVEDLQGMAEELLSTGMANRENVAKLVRFELDRALGKVGLATGEEVAELTARVRQLEVQLREAREQAAAAQRGSSGGGKEQPAKKAPAKKTAKKAPAKKAAKKVAKKTAKKTVKKAVKKTTSSGGDDK
ncbi:MAG: phasin family protein [Stackebrandtia sp.]